MNPEINPEISKEEVPEDDESELAKLTDEEIIAMKEQINASLDLLPQVCRKLAMETIHEMEEHQRGINAERAADKCVASSLDGVDFSDREVFASHVAFYSAHCAQVIQAAVDLPGAEWTQGAIAPEEIAALIQEIETEEEEA